jgi:outer membrane protein
MNRKFLATLPLLLIPVPLGADVLGVQVGGGGWLYDISGTARYQTQDSSNDIDVNDDLGYDDDNLAYLYGVFEHPVPLLPNIRLSYARIDSNARGVMRSTVVYGDITINVNEPVRSQVELDQTDITLYYEVVDNVVSLDLGLNAKYIDSKAEIVGETAGKESADVSGWVPMLYAGLGADLPFTGFALRADGSLVQYQDSKFYDYSIGARYTSPWHVGADLGYRAIKLDLDDFDDSFADVKFDGIYAGLHLMF